MHFWDIAMHVQKTVQLQSQSFFDNDKFQNRIKFWKWMNMSTQVKFNMVLKKKTKTKTTRHVAVTDGVPCRLWDIDPWLIPVSLFIPPMWCKCKNYMKILSNIRVMHFKWKSKFDPYDPKWPQVDIWPNNIGSGSQADKDIRVLWSCYATWTSYSIFRSNDLLNPVTPKWPQIDTWPHKVTRGSQSDQYV